MLDVQHVNEMTARLRGSIVNAHLSNSTLILAPVKPYHLVFHDYFSHVLAPTDDEAGPTSKLEAFPFFESLALFNDKRVRASHLSFHHHLRFLFQAEFVLNLVLSPG